MQTSFDSDAMHIDPAGRRSARSTDVLRQWDDEGVRLASPPDAEGERFEVTATADSFSWREGATVALDGRFVGPGLHWHLPDAEKGMYYVARMLHARRFAE